MLDHLPTMLLLDVPVGVRHQLCLEIPDLFLHHIKSMYTVLVFFIFDTSVWGGGRKKTASRGEKKQENEASLLYFRGLLLLQQEGEPIDTWYIQRKFRRGHVV